MSEENANLLLRFDGFHCSFKCRMNNGNLGGGVAILVRNNIKTEENNSFEELELEVCAVTIKTKSRSDQWSKFLNRCGSSPTSSRLFWNRINMMKSKKSQTTCPHLWVKTLNMNQMNVKRRLFIFYLQLRLTS
jgi:hypothetical protein